MAVSAIAFLVACMGLASIVAFVAAPFAGTRPRTDGPTPTALAALERRDRALAALRELEFDHRTGKITDEDYASLVGPLRAEAAGALQDLAGLDGTA
ncbi:MAG TPA: hypothetical protein VFA56_13715 [Gaiellaceae bacterium]|nr:hypothetical protein [Gaiellaceae bacterium]